MKSSANDKIIGTQKFERVENIVGKGGNAGIFSFSHNVLESFLSQDRYKSGLCGKELIVEKGEDAGNHHFLLFPQCFLPYESQII